MNFFYKIIFFLIIASSNLNAQYHEIGAFLGGSNYIGDIGPTRYISPNNSAFGLLYKWNLTTRYSLRAGINLSKIKSSDYDTGDLNRFKRGYKFDNTINEGVLGIEFNFIDFNLHNGKPVYTPYTFFGLSYFRFNRIGFTPPIKSPINYRDTLNDSQTYYDSNMAIPIILGIKMNPNPLWVIGLEIGVRYTLTDAIDGSTLSYDSSIDPKDPTNPEFGNIGNNDWYVFTGLTISFTFGDLPCYCKE